MQDEQNSPMTGEPRRAYVIRPLAKKDDFLVISEKQPEESPEKQPVKQPENSRKGQRRYQHAEAD